LATCALAIGDFRTLAVIRELAMSRPAIETAEPEAQEFSAAASKITKSPNLRAAP
jgi:hypothetical protein